MNETKTCPEDDNALIKQKLTSLIQAGRLDEASAICETILRVKPSDVDATYALGWIAFCQKDHRKALDLFYKVVELKPDHSRAHNNLGWLLINDSKPVAASKHLKIAIQLEPGLREAHTNLSASLIMQAHYQEAREVLQNALDRIPQDPEILANLAAVKSRMGQRNEAINDFKKVLTLAPDLPEAHIGLGKALRREGNFLDAANSLCRALEIVPDFPYLLGDLLRIKMDCCDWQSFDNNVAVINEGVRAGKPAIRPFSFMGLSDSPHDQLKCARTFGMDLFPPLPNPIWQGERYKHDRIRVAYVSADFCAHPMAYLMSGLLEQHDRSRFEIFGISFGAEQDTVYASRLRNAVDQFIPVSDKTDREIAQLIRDLEIDIAVDRKGYTRGCRPGVFAMRPAPIQVNYLAYPGTMGINYIDYIIADRVVVSDDYRDQFSEKVIYLPHSYQCNDNKRRASGVAPSRSEVGLPEDAFVFCSFNTCWKITPQVFDCWMRIMLQVESSVLWLMDRNPLACSNLRKEAENRGVAPHRLVFAPFVDNSLHLARQRLADLCLDTFPYGAHTTASDAIYSGIPIVTCAQRAFASRVTASILKAVGLEELITETFDDFEALAVRLARDENALKALKEKLAKNIGSFPLYDTLSYTRYLEAAYYFMWTRYQRGEPPADFPVSAFC